MANITYLPVQGSIKLGGEKVIALNQTNIDAIKSSYNKDAKVLASQNTVSNKDLLSQSFGGSPVPSVPEIQIPSVPTFKEPASVNPTPNNIVQDLESTAVNMNTVPSVDNVMNNLNANENLISSQNNLSDVNVEPATVNMEPVNAEPLPAFIPDAPTSTNVSAPILDTQPTNTVSEVSEVTQPSIPVNSEFNVSNAPNIFDLPPMDTGITQNNMDMNNNLGMEAVENTPEAVVENSPILTINSANDVNLGTPSNEQNIFSTPVVPSVDELKNTQISETVPEKSEPVSMDSLNSDILEARIAIEKSNYNLYLSLAENSKKMAELLEKQIKKNEIDNTNVTLENTASNLFNSNGILDDTKVLGLNKVA